ncbi:MAG: ABC transporter permease subunit [Planctomycetaceae bacterium]|nr:ABC transporter permease subunit [Planctomycetaceae bacterium]
MYLRNNPVLQRELLLNLRHPRSFLLLGVFVSLLGLLVVVAWPEARKIDMTNSSEGRTLVNLFFLGQYLIASLMAPGFAAGAIAGEKERKSYEMLLASPLRPWAIVIGKLFASLGHIALLIVASLPIAMLCLPLGGVSFYELLALYGALLCALVTYTAISLACSSYFNSTSASLVVSYLLILPSALVGLLFWNGLEGGGAELRLTLTVTVIPVITVLLTTALLGYSARTLLNPADVGSEGKTVYDEATEQRQAVGLVIRRHEFPDRLFAPPKRDDLLEDGANAVYDKEMRSELFSQGSLMLRLVIQVSMLVALPMMAVCLYGYRQYLPVYIAYVVLFNLLVGPVFSAGSVTSERERETLELLLVTTFSPWQIIWGKLLSGLRISTVLTSFLLWPLAWAFVFDGFYWTNYLTVLGYLALIAVVCLTTSLFALLCSVLAHKTSQSLLAAYVVLGVLLFAPPAANLFVDAFLPELPERIWIERANVFSPLATIFTLPLRGDQHDARPGDWSLWGPCVGGYLVFNVLLVVIMWWRFARRWRMA